MARPPTPRALAASLEADLRAVADPERARQERRCLASSLLHRGASVPARDLAAAAEARLAASPPAAASARE